MKPRLSSTLVVFLLVLGVFASPFSLGAQQEPEKPKPTSAVPAKPTVDIDELVSECQQSVRGADYVGLVWWLPMQFWEESSRQSGTSGPESEEMLKGIAGYLSVAVVVAKVKGMEFSFVSERDIRASIVLRDAAGKEYKPLEQVSLHAQVLASVIRPLMSNLVGRLGENITLLYFPAKNERGEAIADPLRSGNFAVVLKKIVGEAESVYEWRLPLTSLLPPKYCPTGKERVKANWLYCPWHGTKLDSPPDGSKP